MLQSTANYLLFITNEIQFLLAPKTKCSICYNLFVVVGIGGLTIQFYHFEFSPVATALVVGLLVNVITYKKKKDDDASYYPK